MAESFTLYGKIPLRDGRSSPDKETLEGIKRSMMDQASSQLSNLLSDGKPRYTEIFLQESKRVQDYGFLFWIEMQVIIAFTRFEDVTSAGELFYCNIVNPEGRIMSLRGYDGLSRCFESKDPGRHLWRSM